MFLKKRLLFLQAAYVLSVSRFLNYAPNHTYRSIMFRSAFGALRRYGGRPPSRRLYATVTDLTQYPKPGDQLHGFTFKRSRHFPELELSALELEHQKTGAQYLHVARDDTNNVFSIGFKTNPPDATGVPHILEHTTLCGSEK